jgi:hypothetical protein
MLLVIKSIVCLVPEGTFRSQVLCDVCRLVACLSLWDISTTVLALGLFGEMCNTVSDVVETPPQGAKASVVNCWMGGTAVIDGAARSRGRRTTFARACQRGKGEFTAV